MRPRRLLINVTEDWYFCSHRLPLAKAAKAAGYEVFVVTRVREHGDLIRSHGLTLIPFEIARTGRNPLRELGTLARLVAVYRRLRPDVVHQVAMKPVMYGSIAARAASTPLVVNALAGMGWLFTSRALSARLLKPIVRRWLRGALGSGKVIVQNPDDGELLVSIGVPAERVTLIPGSGVDLDAFTPSPEPAGPPLVVLPARLLWDKGVGEFVAAARALRARGVEARFALAGTPDPMNPASITEAQLAEWVGEGVVEHLGWIDDMPGLLRRAHVVCLPSYREGMPKSLLEAAAAGKPIVTTDVPGCRDVVAPEDNGLLVPVRDAVALEEALARLIGAPELRERMGRRGRERAVAEFGIDRVVSRTLELYDAPAR
jgi:glycosyltransferase involved in cell wall biosynthesis